MLTFEQRQEINRKSYQRNRENKIKYAREYRKKNIEICKERQRVYQNNKYHTNEKYRQERLAYRKKYYLKNKEKCKQIIRKCSKRDYMIIAKNGCVICGVNDIWEIHGMNGSHLKEDLVCLCLQHHGLFTRKVVKSLEELIDYYIN